MGAKVTLKEKINSEVIKSILNRPDEFNDEIIKKLKSYCFSLKKKNGGYNNIKKIEYNYKNELDVGRLFAENSVQSMCKLLRGLLLKDIYFDIDFSNCLGHILYFIYTVNGNIFSHCKNIEEFCIDREKFFNDILAADTSKKLKIEDVKELVISTAYGYNYSKKYGENYILKNFQSECGELANFIVKYKSEKYNEVISKELIDFNKQLKKIDTNHNKFFVDKPAYKFSVLNYYIQSIENTCLLTMVKTFKEHGREIGVLIFDGCCVEKLKNEEKFPEDLIKLAEDQIKSTVGITMKITQKEFNIKGYEWVFEKNDDIYDKVNVKIPFNRFFEINKNNIFVQYGVLYIKNPKTGEYDYGEKILYEVISRGEDYLIFKDINGKEHDFTTGTGRDLLIKEILNRHEFLDSIGTDRKKEINNSIDKLKFKDGIYDFYEDRFYKNGEFDENNYIFFKNQTIQFNFDECFSEEKMEYLFNTFYSNPYVNDNKDSGIFHLDSITFMLRGRSDIRNLLISFGEPKSGKGENTTILKNAFGGFVKSFDADDLMIPVNGKINNDPLEKRWISEAVLYRMRILIGNEIRDSANMEFDTTFAKKLISGGADEIRFRNFYGFDMYGIFHAGIVIYVNDLFGFNNPDKAFKTRGFITQSNNSFINPEDIEDTTYQFPSDPLLKQRVNDSEYIKAYIGMVITHVRKRGLGKNLHLSVPECVKKTTNLFVELPEERLKRRLEDHFEFNDNLKITPDIIMDKLKLKITENRLTRMLLKCKLKQSADRRYILGIGEKIDITEETEFDIFKKKLLSIFKLTHNKKDVISYKVIKEKIGMNLSDVTIGKYLDDIGLNSIRRKNGMFRECIILLD